MAKKNEHTGETTIDLMRREIVRVYVVGDSPIIMNRLAEKAQRQLLLPGAPKNRTEKAQTLKHYPLEEYRSSPHRINDAKAPTLLAMPATAFKGALRNVALEMPGVNKTQLGRLTYIAAEMVGIYGVPQLLMSVVRSADMNKTPDIRTRAILPRWAATFDISYVAPTLTATAIMNLMANAGMIIGVGDWRPEKGAGAYGRFRLVCPDDSEFSAIVKGGGRKQQEAALNKPEFFNEDTRELYDWCAGEVERRGRAAEQPKATTTRRKAKVVEQEDAA